MEDFDSKIPVPDVKTSKEWEQMKLAQDCRTVKPQGGNRQGSKRFQNLNCFFIGRQVDSYVLDPSQQKSKPLPRSEFWARKSVVQTTNPREQDVAAHCLVNIKPGLSHNATETPCTENNVDEDSKGGKHVKEYLDDNAGQNGRKDNAHEVCQEDKINYGEASTTASGNSSDAFGTPMAERSTGTRHSRQSDQPRGNNILDTVTMARKEREKYGPWEAEVSYGGEADLYRHLHSCEKNPGHLKFVPVDQFNVEHLPPGYLDNELVDLVRALSDLTVRVSVKYVSDRRPEGFPGIDTPYPCYRDRGSDLMRVGTGWMKWVEKYSNVGKTCRCEDCLSSGSPRTEFGRIVIRTATHVVYDELEAAHTTCHLFFDRGSTPAACSGVVTLSGMSCLRSNVGEDTCWMTYETHDLELTDKLDKMVDRYNSLCHHLPPRPPPPLAIIVSHPHGCSKQVSVGYARKPKEKSPHRNESIYTTATCPGSGGAHVWVYGNCNDEKSRNPEEEELIAPLLANQVLQGHTLKRSCKQNLRTWLPFAVSLISCTVTLVTLIYAIVVITRGEVVIETQTSEKIQYTYPEVCIDCLKLVKNPYEMNEPDLLLDDLTKKQEDGVVVCCAQNSSQMSSLLEAIMREQKMSDLDDAELSAVSAHKAMRAESVEDSYLQDILRFDPIYHNLRTEHVEGILVLKDGFVIQHSGIYFIYWSVAYRLDSSKTDKKDPREYLFSSIYRTRPNFAADSGVLLTSVHTKLKIYQKANETSFTGGSFYLKAGDFIQVLVSEIEFVDFDRESTYMGLVLLGEKVA